MGDFGYKTKGVDTSDIHDHVSGTLYTLTENGIGESITLFLYSTVAGRKVKCVLYDSNRNLVTNGVTEEKTLSDTNDWTTFNFEGTKPVLPAGDYTIASWADGSMVMYRTSDEAFARWWEEHTYNGFPASLGASDRTGKFSIYCTYLVKKRLIGDGLGYSIS